jgi:hypothetical protein
MSYHSRLGTVDGIAGRQFYLNAYGLSIAQTDHLSLIPPTLRLVQLIGLPISFFDYQHYIFVQFEKYCVTNTEVPLGIQRTLITRIDSLSYQRPCG